MLSNRAKLNAFLWLTLFLRIFIPGYAIHVMKLKEVYLVQVLAEIKPKRDCDGQIKKCNKNLIKKAKI